MCRMKKNSILFVLLILLTACGNSPEELAFQAQEAATDTLLPPAETATPTTTPRPTETPTPTATPLPTITPIPSPTPFAGGGKLSFWGSVNPGELKQYLINSDGSAMEIIFDTSELSSKKPSHMQFYPVGSWSPNGKYLSFYLLLSDENISQLYLYDLALDSTRLLAEVEAPWAPIAPIFSYWSEDGRYIFYNLNSKLNVVDLQNNFNISEVVYPVNAGVPLGYMNDGELLVSMTNLTNNNNLILIEKGNALGFNEKGEFLPPGINEQANSISVMNLDGEILREYKFDVNMKEAWQNSSTISRTIDQNGVIFTSCDGPNGETRNCSINQYSFADGEFTELFSFPNIQSIYFDLSPDGEKIVISTCSWENGGQHNLSVYDVDSGQVLFHNNADDCSQNPIWSPDGNHILYLWQRSENFYLVESKLFLWDLESGQIKDLVSDFFYLDFAIWGP